MLRGWAKELLVGFAVVVAVALNFLLKAYVPIVKNLPEDDPTLFWVRIHRARIIDLLRIPDRHQCGPPAGRRPP